MQPEDANKQHLTFSKEERICSKLTIERLFDKQQKVSFYPYRCFYDFTPVTDEVKVNRILVVVPKRTFKHAVDRNRLKRLTREAWRLHHRQELDLHLPDGIRADLMFYFVGRDLLPYNSIESKIIEILHRLTKVAESR
ncbi:MAG: ribonuclease P protein component [Bacteroidales bacterium]|nr:ribonuclease P protein component [Bacteroidales bacterium]